MSSDGEVSEELPAEENSHLRRPITGHCLVKLLLRESLKCSPVLPARKTLDLAFFNSNKQLSQAWAILMG